MKKIIVLAISLIITNSCSKNSLGITKNLEIGEVKKKKEEKDSIHLQEALRLEKEIQKKDSIVKEREKTIKNLKVKVEIKEAKPRKEKTALKKEEVESIIKGIEKVQEKFKDIKNKEDEK